MRLLGVMIRQDSVVSMLVLEMQLAPGW